MMILLDERLLESIQKYNDTDWDAERERVKHDRGLTQIVGIRAVNAVAFKTGAIVQEHDRTKKGT